MPAGAEETRVFISQPHGDAETLTAEQRSPNTTQDVPLPAHTSNSQRADSGAALFRSILFCDEGMDGKSVSPAAPACFADLNLGQIIDGVTAGLDEYNLKPYFYTPLQSVEAVNYRYDVFRDLETATLAAAVRSFAEEMRRMRAMRAQEDKLYYKRQKQRWFLDAVDTYCNAVMALRRTLAHTEKLSRGFAGLRDYLSAYVASEPFRRLVADTQKLKTDLAAVIYSLHLNGRQITVSEFHSEPDYGADVLHTFEKFSQQAAKEYQFKLRDAPDMNHIEAAILDMVANLYPETFAFLEDYTQRHSDYLDDLIAAFDREIHFYLAWIDYITSFKNAGLSFCYPTVSSQSKEVYGTGVFDLALAAKLVPQHARIVTNDFSLHDPERILVVSGPNQGGKTTFARMFGQLHYLACIGCTVPGTEARLFLCDRLFTHFEKEEYIHNQTGKLEDELIRIRAILQCATPDSILIMNESFLSTTLKDALFLSREIMQRIIQLDMLCVSVTFLDEMASLSKTTVSMVSTVDPQNPARRTFKVLRRPADGLAYADAVAETYHLTYGSVKTRILSNIRRRATE